MPETTGATHPNCAVGGAQQTGDRLSQDWFAELAVPEAQEGIHAIRYPEGARGAGASETNLTRSGQRPEIVCRLQGRFETGFRKAIQPVAGADPDVAFAIDQRR